MKRVTWTVAALFAAALGVAPGTADAETVVTSAVSRVVHLDTRGGPIASDGSETLAYSARWSGGAGATVTLSQSGDARYAARGPFAVGLDGEGEWNWSARCDGTYTLTHATVEGGVTSAVETAVFVVTGRNVPFAAGDVTLTDYVGVYDGLAHTLGIATNAIEGLEIRYWVQLSPTSPMSPSDTLPLFTGVTNATVWVEASAPGYFPVTNAVTVTIAPREMAVGDAAVSLDLPEGGYVADGAAKEPAVSVLCGGQPLAAGVDYDIVYSNNTAPGTATVTVTFKGNYAGTASATFTIAAPPEPDPEPEPEPEPEARRLWRTDEALVLTSTAQWDGYLRNADGRVAGTIAVKVGRPGRTSGLSRVSVRVRVAGARASSYTVRTVLDGVLDATTRDGRDLRLQIGAHGLHGTVGDYTVDGARNVFSARDTASREAAGEALARWRGTYAAVWSEGDRVTFLSVKIGARGRVRVAGTRTDGMQLATTAQLMVGEEDGAVAAEWTKRGVSGAFLLWLGGDGSVACASLRGGAAAQAGSVDAALAPDARLRIDAAALAAAIPGFREDLTFPGGPGGDPARLTLRLRKDGTFSGAFRAYADRGRRVRSVTVTLRGAVLDGVGCGVARIPGAGSLPVAIQ